MMDRHILNADTQTILLLTGHLEAKNADGVSPLTLSEYNRLAQWLQTEELRPAELLQTEGIARLRQAGSRVPDAERISRLLDRGGLLALQVETWTNHGLWVISRGEDIYPRRLKDKLKHSAPPILFGVGDLGLLNQGGLGMVGSRNADGAALEFTRKVAQRCVLDGVQVISGGARGVDQEAMLGALEVEGAVIGVLADNLAKASVSGNYRESLRAERLVLVSPYAPHSRFNVGNAMGRNKLIYALSDWTVVVSTDAEKGGTWSGATENLRHGWVPVFVRMGSDVPKGNRRLFEQGALKLESQSLDRTDQTLRNILHQLEIGQLSPSSAAAPLGLFDQQSSVDQAIPQPEKPTEQSILQTIDPDSFWNEMIWPVLFHLVTAHTSINREKLSTALGVKVTQSDEWLKRAVEEGKLNKHTRPVRYVLPDEGQMTLLEGD